MAGQDPSRWGAGWAELGRTAASGGEQPTQAAELKVTVGPASAGGRVPQRDAHHFITVGGIAWCTTAAIVGVVLTLQLASPGRAPGAGNGLTMLALAELLLGLLGSALIAACGRRAAPRIAAAGRQAPFPPALEAGPHAREDQTPSRAEAPGPDDRGRMSAPVPSEDGPGSGG
jgi:hypothetical protein